MRLWEEAQDAEMQENDSGSGESDDEMEPTEKQSNTTEYSVLLSTDHVNDENLIQVDDNIEPQEGAEDADNTRMDVESSKENTIPDKTEPASLQHDSHPLANPERGIFHPHRMNNNLK